MSEYCEYMMNKCRCPEKTDSSRKQNYVLDERVYLWKIKDQLKWKNKDTLLFDIAKTYLDEKMLFGKQKCNEDCLELTATKKKLKELEETYRKSKIIQYDKVMDIFMFILICMSNTFAALTNDNEVDIMPNEYNMWCFMDNLKQFSNMVELEVERCYNFISDSKILSFSIFKVSENVKKRKKWHDISLMNMCMGNNCNKWYFTQYTFSIYYIKFHYFVSVMHSTYTRYEQIREENGNVW